VCLLWSSSFLLMKKASLAFTASEISCGRVIGGAVVLAVIWTLRPGRLTLTRADLFPVAIVSAVGLAWPFFIQPVVISRHGSAFMALLVSAVPFLTILISAALFKVRPERRHVVGVAGALFCLGLLLADGRQRQIPAVDFGLALTVPLSYAATNILVRRRLAHATSFDLTLASLALTAVIMLPFAAGQTAGSDARHDSSAYWQAVAALAFLGVIGTAFGSLVFNYLIRAHGPLFAGMATNVVPIFAVVWGWLDREPITSLQLAALAGLAAMVSLVQYGSAAPSTPPPEASTT
jgi:drug/metabolite transporter (DMT)-like permease